MYAKDINVVFVLFGELTTISDIVDRLKSAGKIVIVHLDLIGGLAVREESVRFIKQYTKADGIISDKTRYDKICQGIRALYYIPDFCN